MRKEWDDAHECCSRWAPARRADRASTPAAEPQRSLYDEHPMQRYWRDMHAIGHHRALDWDDVAEQFGRAELGLPPRGPIF
ncbi:MAG TPA: hypothetical protein VEQ11_17085 [Chloroflexota bacterium]|nr:hypothetical protein [Chloroflexota bacterium]